MQTISQTTIFIKDDFSKDPIPFVKVRPDVGGPTLADIDGKIVAGVASGLAWYFGIRSIFIRLAFVLLFVNRETAWLAILAYVLCWIFIPKAENNFEKVAPGALLSPKDPLQLALGETRELGD